jgi:3-phenylpropionate/cinnamic acid dioxygenase small subunit
MNHRGEIENLLYAYQERLDAGDLVGVAALFEHATIGGSEGSTMRGSADLLATFKTVLRLYEDGTPRTTHTTLNPIIEVDEEAGTATSRSVYVVYQQTDSFPLQPVVTGRYVDKFELVDGAWRYSQRDYVVSLLGDLSAHQLVELRETPGDQ